MKPASKAAKPASTASAKPASRAGSKKPVSQVRITFIILCLNIFLLYLNFNEYTAQSDRKDADYLSLYRPKSNLLLQAVPKSMKLLRKSLKRRPLPQRFAFSTRRRNTQLIFTTLNHRPEFRLSSISIMMCAATFKPRHLSICSNYLRCAGLVLPGQ